MLNSNTKEAPVKDKAVIKAEKTKHDQNKRASEKRGLPKFDMEMARKLLDGKFHEEDEEDEDEDDCGHHGNEIDFATAQEKQH